MRSDERAAAIADYLGTQLHTNGADPHTEDGPKYPRGVRASALVVRPIEWLAKGFLLDNEYTMIAAPGGSYKSTVMLSIVCAVAAGADVLGAFAVSHKRRCMVVSEEDPEDVLRNRLDAIVKGHGYDPAILDDIIVHAVDGVQVTDLGWQLALQQECEEEGVGFVCFDPLADLLDGDQAETNNEAARPVIRWFRQLSKQGRATLVVHHYGKENESRKGQDRVRGASAWANGSRGVYYVETKADSLWLGCDKISRIPKPKEARELALTIESEPDNEAMWVSAKIELAHKPEPAWVTPNLKRLTPSEKGALKAVSNFDDAISWTEWKDASPVQKTALADARRRLVDLGYVRAEEAGMHAGKKRYIYRVTEEGRNALM